MSNLRTLALALNPDKNTSGTVLWPKLQELFVYVKTEDQFCITKLLKIAEAWAVEGAELETGTIVSSQELFPASEVLKLKNYVSHVEYRLGNNMPEWDAVPGDTHWSNYWSLVGLGGSSPLVHCSTVGFSYFWPTKPCCPVCNFERLLDKGCSPSVYLRDKTSRVIYKTQKQWLQLNSRSEFQRSIVLG